MLSLKYPAVCGLAVMLCAAATAQADRFVQMTFASSGVGFRSIIRVFDDKPLASDNFFAYVDSGAWFENGDPSDGIVINRGIPGFVDQFGGFFSDGSPVDLDGDPNTPNPTVPDEFGANGISRSNTPGFISYAKTDLPNSATNQIFVNLNNNTFLDPGASQVNGGFEPFAQIVDSTSLQNFAFITNYPNELNALQDGGETPPFVTSTLNNTAPGPAGGRFNLSNFSDVPLWDNGSDYFFWQLASINEIPEGDANADGRVSVGDVAILAANFGAQQNVGWDKGDFNGDGRVSVGDVAILAANFGADFNNIDAIPEPTSLALLGLGSLCLFRRRR